MATVPIKQRVRESFDRAALTYDGAAIVQRRICERLLEELAATAAAGPDTPDNPASILDAGCGTGYGAAQLRKRWPEARITGIDFAPSMLALARKEVDCCQVADIEKLPFAQESFDLWWSSLSIQWCKAHTVFREAARVLVPSGRIAFSTLCPDTFAELRTAFASVDQHRHTLPFDEPQAINAALAQTGLREIRLIREKHTVYYPDLKSLLRSIKAIGAQNVGAGGRSGMMGRSAWLKVEEAYERFREPAGLPASYDALLGFARK